MTAQPWQLDPTAAVEALRVLRAARTVLVPTHQHIDADGLASALALVHALAQVNVKAVPVVSDGKLPQSLRFLPGVDRVLRYGVDRLPDYEVLLLVDCADRRRLGQFYSDDPGRVDGRVPIVNIDHHITNVRFGVVNIVEPDAAAAAEIVAALLTCWGTEMTTTIAQTLLAGIYGDTLGLRTQGTTSRTMRTAADLVDAGANPAPIVDHLFTLKPASTVCLYARALQNVQWTGTLIWTELTAEMFRECGANQSEAEGMVNFLTGTEGSRAAAILYEDKHGWRVSLRSLETVDVSAVASVFGGGGHPRAAGCFVAGGEAEKQAFLARAAALIAPPEPTDD